MRVTEGRVVSENGGDEVNAIIPIIVYMNRLTQLIIYSVNK
jgi:hypothetical protein